jgi:VIT1/CCC1 family predicted Fe2+/Mn2+ transporter
MAREKAELAKDPDAELRELTAIYVARGLDPALAHDVAIQLSKHDALAAHARDELGISNAFSAKPMQAALASAASFAVGAALPLGVAVTNEPSAKKQRSLLLSLTSTAADTTALRTSGSISREELSSAKLPNDCTGL